MPQSTTRAALPGTISDLIRDSRRTARVSQVELARRAGLSLATVANAERGLASPATLRCLAAALGLAASPQPVGDRP